MSKRNYVDSLILLTTVIVGVTIGQQSYSQEVPVLFDPAPNSQTDDKAVVTTLFEYVSQESDTTTGKSISFSFPRSYYGLAANADGGPQYRVNIRVDVDALAPIVPREEEIELSRLPPQEIKEKLWELRDRDLRINIYSSTKSVARVLRDIAAYRAWKKGAPGPIAEICDLVLFDDQVDLRQPDKSYSAPSNKNVFERSLGLVGVLRAEMAEDALTAVSCARQSDVCIFQAPFRDWMKSFTLRRGDLCKWKQVSGAIDNLLNQHVVGQTPRRSGSSDY
jgi:hypothetical protein